MPGLESRAGIFVSGGAAKSCQGNGIGLGLLCKKILARRSENFPSIHAGLRISCGDFCLWWCSEILPRHGIGLGLLRKRILARRSKILPRHYARLSTSSKHISVRLCSKIFHWDPSLSIISKNIAVYFTQILHWGFFFSTCAKPKLKSLRGHLLPRAGPKLLLAVACARQGALKVFFAFLRGSKGAFGAGPFGKARGSCGGAGTLDLTGICSSASRSWPRAVSASCFLSVTKSKTSMLSNTAMSPAPKSSQRQAATHLQESRLPSAKM